MISFRKVATGLLAAALTTLIGVASPAQAQYPCTGAPGEQMAAVKTEPGGATVPLCIPGASPQEAPAPAPQGTHAAFAFHVDASDFWIDGNYTGPGHAGERISLEQCNRVMGGGCVSGGGWGNAAMVVYRNGRGELFWGWSYDKASVTKAQADCRANAILPCEQVLKLGSSTRERFPGADARKRYLAGAWVNGSEGYDDKLYIASGEPTYAAAADKAINACRAATGGRECAVIDYTADGVLQAYRSADEQGVVVETTSARAAKATQGVCKKAKVKCTLQAQYDARRPGQFVHDFKSAGGGE